MLSWTTCFWKAMNGQCCFHLFLKTSWRAAGWEGKGVLWIRINFLDYREHLLLLYSHTISSEVNTHYTGLFPFSSANIKTFFESVYSTIWKKKKLSLIICYADSRYENEHIQSKHIWLIDWTLLPRVSTEYLSMSVSYKWYNWLLIVQFTTTDGINWFYVPERDIMYFTDSWAQLSL